MGNFTPASTPKSLHFLYAKPITEVVGRGPGNRADSSDLPDICPFDSPQLPPESGRHLQLAQGKPFDSPQLLADGPHLQLAQGQVPTGRLQPPG